MPIKSFHSSTDRHIQVQTTGTPYIPVGSMSQGVGMVRFNTSSSTMEVYDGTAWLNIETHATVGLNERSARGVEWAIAQMERMQKLEKLAEDNPTIADALTSLRHAEEQLRLVEILCEQEES